MLYDDARLERERQAAFLADLDRSFGDRGDCLQVMLGRVFAEVAVPTSVPKYFAVHPVIPGGAEAEGGAGSNTVLSSAAAYVLVLGPKVPVAGDDLVCYQVGDRWVAQYGGAEDELPPEPCQPCSLPGAAVLDAAYVFHLPTDPIGSPTGSATQALERTATAPAWMTAFSPTLRATPNTTVFWTMPDKALFPFQGGISGNQDVSYRFVMYCANTGTLVTNLYLEEYIFSGGAWSRTNARNFVGFLGDCDPYEIHFTAPNNDNWTVTAP